MIDQVTPAPAADQAPPSIEARLGNFLSQEVTSDEPEAAPAEDEARSDAAPPEEGQAAPDELTADDLPADDAPAAAPTGDAIEITHNGQKVALPRDEVVKLAQQGYDYTQKTMALAEQSRQVAERLARVTAIEQVAPQLQNAQAQVAALGQQLAPYQTVDWVALATNDPLEYSKVRAQYDVLAQTYQRAAGQYNQMREAIGQQAKALQAQALQTESAKLVERIPEWKDPAKFKAGATALREYLVAEGAAPEEVDGLTSSIAVAIAYKAMRYDQLLKAKTEKSKLLRTAPPVTRPGATQSSSAAQADKTAEMRQRLKKTGDVKDAVGLMMQKLR